MTGDAKIDRLGSAAADRVKAILLQLRDESERGAALVGAATLDDLLRRMLMGIMIDHDVSAGLVGDGTRAPLGSFAARTDAAFALGLIADWERSGCHVLRGIRNKFAHHVEASFTDQSVIDRCSNLSEWFGHQPFPALVSSKARDQYCWFATCMAVSFEIRLKEVPTKRLSNTVWQF